MSGRYYESGFLLHDIKMVTGSTAEYREETNNIIIYTPKNALTFLLDFLFTKWGFSYLLLMTCTKINESFTLTYVLSSRKILIPVIVRTTLSADTPVYTTIGMIYKNAFQYEEMIYNDTSIVFEGNPSTVSYYVKNLEAQGEEHE
ncbi:MAG: NADH-quinone oxidoreductase subunit C [bacterium]|nr:NADH-quinone oxidoreductase subunit C [bacterium]